MTQPCRDAIGTSCFSLSQAQGIVRHIDAAIGMNRPIGDAAAIELATGFYRGLAYGLSLQDAFDLGLNALKLEQISETQTPQLLTREGIDAGSVYLLGGGAA